MTAGVRIQPRSPEQLAFDEFNMAVMEIVLFELHRWQADPKIPSLGIAGDICEALRGVGLLRSHLQ